MARVRGTCRICGNQGHFGQDPPHICNCSYCGRNAILEPKQVGPFTGNVAHICRECHIMKRPKVWHHQWVEYLRKIEDGECVWHYVEEINVKTQGSTSA